MDPVDRYQLQVEREQRGDRREERRWLVREIGTWFVGALTIAMVIKIIVDYS